ncbi:MAG: phosphodiester glycosidase family protein [Deltaproteobacteria bacterium]|nr:phosphodiester glycosidase family protein [Deltaproteobacteria bacterium]
MRRVFAAFVLIVLLWTATASALAPFDSAGASLRAGCPDDTWCEQQVVPGVLWRLKKYADVFGGRQTVNVLEVGMKTPGVSVKPVMQAKAGACQKTSRIGTDSGAVAGVNGGYFDTGACVPLGFRKVDGDVLYEAVLTRPPRSAIGLTAVGGMVIRAVGTADRFDEVTHGLGAGPRLLKDGASVVSEAMAAEEIAGSMNNKHPRTAVGVKGEKLVLVTFDGRTSAGAGVTLDELAQWFEWYGVPDAMNLDGGGSTTMWISGEPDDGVVNYPSDNQKADHYGERSVTEGLFVFYDPPADGGTTDTGADAETANDGSQDAETTDDADDAGSDLSDSSDPSDVSFDGPADAETDAGADAETADTGACREGSLRCAGAALVEVCTGGLWRSAAACGKGASCERGRCVADISDRDAGASGGLPSVAPAGSEGGCSCSNIGRIR